MVTTEADEATGTGPKRQVFVRADKKPVLRTSVAALNAFFESVGKPVAIYNKWGEEPLDGQIYETALVTFKKNKAVEKAVSLSGGQLDGRQVVVGFNTRPPPQRKQACGSCRVFVGNLAFAAGDAAVRAHFEPCGKVLFVRFASNGADTPAGYAFVIFADPAGDASPAHAALGLDGSEICGRTIKVAPAEEKPKDAGGGKGRRTGGGGRVEREREGGEAEAEVEAKRLRPAEWRHDKATGLTAPMLKGKKRRAGGGVDS